MRAFEDRRIVAFLAAGDINASQIADITRIPRSTVRDWLAQPHRSELVREKDPVEFDPASLPESQYTYLLGLYLGDGCLSKMRRDVYRLRIKMDARYPGVIAECVEAMQAVMPTNRVHVQQMRCRAVEIGSYSKRWPLFFPQHGPGRKHERKIELAPWQKEMVDRRPREFLRGLIHSDGCRVLNRVNGKDYPRYFFTQVSQDIRALFCSTCDQLRVEHRRSNWKTTSVARASSVALLDTFIGPKA
jgi:hypothetical protein